MCLMPMKYCYLFGFDIDIDLVLVSTLLIGPTK